MPQEVELPDGRIAEFPDDMSREAITAALKEHAAKPDPVVSRGTILPVGTTASGRTVPAVPNLLYAPVKAGMDLTEHMLAGNPIDDKAIKLSTEAATLGIPVTKFGGAAKAVTAAEPALAEGLVPRLPMAGNSPTTYGIAEVARHLPGGGRITSAAEASLEQVKQALLQTAQKVESGAYPPQNAAKQGLSDWLLGKEIASGAAGTPARVRKGQLAEALGVGEAELTPTQATSRILEMGKSNHPNDIQGLIKAKELMGPQNWGDIQSGTMYNLGAKVAEDGSATFSMQNLIKNYSELTPNGKNLLFGGENGAKATLDAISGLGPQLERMEKLSQPNAIADWLGGITGWGHWAIPGVPSSALLVGNWSVSQLLSRPGLGAPTAEFLKASANWALNPASPKAEAAFRAQGLLLADKLSKETGQDRGEVWKEIQANGPKLEA